MNLYKWKKGKGEKKGERGRVNWSRMLC